MWLYYNTRNGDFVRTQPFAAPSKKHRLISECATPKQTKMFTDWLGDYRPKQYKECVKLWLMFTTMLYTVKHSPYYNTTELDRNVYSRSLGGVL